MTFSARTREKSAAIAQRWLAKALAAYPAESAAAFARQQDRFANPVGHALRLGTRAAVAALLEGQEPGEICSHLDEIVKIRAVQELQPSEAIRFVFLLKEALRRTATAGRLSRNILWCRRPACPSSRDGCTTTSSRDGCTTTSSRDGCTTGTRVG